MINVAPWRAQWLVNGRCQVREDVLFADRINQTGTYPFHLYLWLLHGPNGVAVIDTGPKTLEHFNASTAEYIPGGVTQTPQETTPAVLEQAGVNPLDVKLVLLTHLHYDHCSHVDLFPNAVVVVNRRGFLQAFPQGIHRDVLAPLMNDWPKRLRLALDEENILPGIDVMWVGGHSECSQAILVDTAGGRTAFCGDLAYYYANVEQDRPIGWAKIDEVRCAVERVKQRADLIVPAHDPDIMRRHPSGWIA